MGKSVTKGYSWQIEFVYIFNLVIGAGFLALPKAFSETGWLLGLICLSVLAFMSYMTVTFTIEAMVISDALIRYKDEKKRRRIKPYLIGSNESEKQIKALSVVDYDVIDVHGDELYSPVYDNTKIDEEKIISNDLLFDITLEIEFGQMAKVLFNKLGVAFYTIIICLSLYGGLIIHAAAISKSLTTLVCGDARGLQTNGTVPCENVSNVSVFYMYRIMLAVFTVLICPFAYFHITNMNLLQMFTTTYRWFSLISMVILTLVKIGDNKVVGNSKLSNFEYLPKFFGVAIYSFLCQHSVPTFLTPVKNKDRIRCLVVLDYICIILVYVTILMTAVFAFPTHDIQDIYTLNFTTPSFFKYVLQLFPVVTLSATFPILAIVLRNNLKTLVLTDGKKNYGFFISRILFPSIVIIPPIAVTYCTANVGLLVRFTGTYAGATIQYVIPTLMVFCGRRKANRIFEGYENKFASPFRRQCWIVVIIVVTYGKIEGWHKYN